jgi:hypothetical protein
MQLRMVEKTVADSVSTADQLVIGARMAALSHSPYAMRNIQERNSMYGAIPAEKIEAIFHNRIDAETFTERDIQLLDIADRVHGGSMDAKTWDDLREAHGDTALLDLMVIACNAQWVATMSRAVGLTSVDMVELPEAPAAA